MKKLLPIFIFICVILLGSVALIVFVHPQTATSTKISIVATFYPLGEFARQIGGSLVEVKTVVPNGIEPHDFEPTPKDIIMAENAKLFIYNGSGFDPWATKIAKDATRKHIPSLDASSVISLLPLEPGSQLKNTSTDPHFWLDPISVQLIVQAILKKLIAMDPQHTAIFNQQAGNFISQLNQLDRSYSNALAQCPTHAIITSHAAFQYLSNRYHLTLYTISGLSPDAEPSAKTLADLSTLIKERRIRYIFTESLVSPKLADTLAAESGAQTLVFNPLEGLTSTEQQANKNYLSIMNDNLTNLKTALSCQ